MVVINGFNGNPYSLSFWPENLHAWSYQLKKLIGRCLGPEFLRKWSLLTVLTEIYIFPPFSLKFCKCVLLWPWPFCDHDLDPIKDYTLHPHPIYPIWCKLAHTFSYYAFFMKSIPMTLNFPRSWPWHHQKSQHLTPTLYTNFDTNKPIRLATIYFSWNPFPWPWHFRDLDLDPINRFYTSFPPYIPILMQMGPYV